MRIATLAISSTLAVVVTAPPPALQAQAPSGDAAQVIGIWRGTSTCTDRVAVPGCNDEMAVYEFRPGAKPGTVHWLADKLVNGQRVNMGELDITYDAADTCWKVEIPSPRGKSVWCLAVDGTHMTGSARALPGNETFRKIDLRKDQSSPPSIGSSARQRTSF